MVTHEWLYTCMQQLITKHPLCFNYFKLLFSAAICRLESVVTVVWRTLKFLDLTGTSVHNQRIEGLWRDVNRVLVSRFLNIFLFLEQRTILDTTSEVHLYCLHLVYLPLINEAIDEFIGQWNNHPVTTESNFSPRQLWIEGILRLRNSGYVAISDIVTQGEQLDYDHYGINDDGPVPVMQQDYDVNVPNTIVVLTQEQERVLHEVRDAVRHSGDGDGILAYQGVLEMAEFFLNAAV